MINNYCLLSLTRTNVELRVESRVQQVVKSSESSQTSKDIIRHAHHFFWVDFADRWETTTTKIILLLFVVVVVGRDDDNNSNDNNNDNNHQHGSTI